MPTAKQLLAVGTAFLVTMAPSPPANSGDFEICEFPCCPLSPPYCRAKIVTTSSSLCQYRFNHVGTLDEFQVHLEVSDCDGNPLVGWEFRATLAPTGDTVICGCEPLEKIAVLDAAGMASFSFSRVGGRGTAEVRLGCRSGGSQIWFECTDYELSFTSPDLDASCNPGSFSGGSVVDLGLWAGGLPPNYASTSDYNCDGTVNVVDLGLWASGTVPGTCAP